MLEIRSLSKSFAETVGPRMAPVLDRIDLVVRENQFVCILGPSGCGKTTLLRILAGLAEADSGTVVISGRRVQKPGQDCSMVFQNYGLLPWCTVMENVEFGLKIRRVPRRRRREISQARIDQVGLTGSEKLYPHQISGGMQQRVALARAFAKDPRVLLMDEPFAAVDMGTRERLQDELLTVWSMTKTTVLFVTHSIEEAFYLGDRVIVMQARPGRIVADITTDLPRPRSEAVKGLERFVALTRQARELLRPEASNGR
jgi:NitT/TauT family transport system ATP-binding protein